MIKHIATDASKASAADDKIEALVDQTLDWLRPRLVDLARSTRGALGNNVAWRWVSNAFES